MTTHNTKLKLGFLIVIWGILLSPIFSATRTVVLTGNWNVSTTWDMGNIPLASDDVSMNNNTVVTVPFTAGLLFVQGFTANNSNGITINPFGFLTVDNLSAGDDFTLIVNGTFIVDGNFEAADGVDIIVNGVFTVLGNMEFVHDGSITVNSGGALLVDGNFSGGDRTAIVADGILGIDGNVKLGDDSSADFGGLVGVAGNFQAGDNFDLTVDGLTIITGNLESGPGSTSSGTGTLTVLGNINGPPGFGSLIPLPISLLYFEGKATDEGVLLSWATEIEEVNDHFTLEKSRDGVHFEELAKIKGAGNSFIPLEYDFVDAKPYKLTYYRLSQTDFDGTTTFFDIISVLTKSHGDVKVYPTLIKEGLLNVELPEPDRFHTLVLADLSGRIVWQEALSAEKNTLLLPGHLDSGMYVVRLLGDQGSLSKAQKVMILK